MVTHTFTSIRRLKTNGQEERVNSVILSMSLTQVSQEDEWDQCLRLVQRQVNNSEIKVTHKTTSELLHGYRPRFELWEIRELSETANT
jgi:hypothetical protein